MKKSVILGGILVATLLVSGAATLTINGLGATDAVSAVESGQNLVAVNSDLAGSGTTKLSTKGETVYVITNADGGVNKSFVGNTINNSGEQLPVELKVTYYLDGAEISAEELAGKTGHVKMVYEFMAKRSYQNKLVPFLTVTGMSLDGNKFSNVKVMNGKVAAENDGTIVLGYALVGVNADLGTDFLPESFAVEADVEDFELGTVYSFATNELLAEIDTSKLNSVDSVINAINELGSGLEQIVAGAGDLSNGLETLVAGVSKVQAGAGELQTGAGQLAEGMEALNNKVGEFVPQLEALAGGLATLSAGSEGLNNGVQGTFSELIGKIRAIASVAAEQGDSMVAGALNQLADGYESGLPELYGKMAQYIGTVDYMAGQTAGMDTAALVGGVAELKNGADKLAAGTTELKTGIDALADGAGQLSAGSKTLNEGLATLKTQGIDKLVSFANNDLNSFMYNFRATVNAAKSYHYYSNPNAESVKFIFKTASVK